MSQDLHRFVAAQDPVFDRVEGELLAGRKDSHWMWFVFPQLRGLGRSRMAQRFGIADADEASAFAAHPVLGPRLDRAARLILRHEGIPAARILGPVDAMKLCSCATLFEGCAPDPSPFARILDAFCQGERCAPTLAILGR